MKLLTLLILIPLTAYGNYADPAAIDHVSKSKFSVYMTKERCDQATGSSCSKVPARFNYEYHEVSGGVVIENATSKAAYDQQLSDDAAAKAAMDSARASQKCGSDVKAYMLVINAPKNLSATQVDKFYDDADLRAIQDQLSGGSLDSARAKMVAYSPDDDPVTQSDKDAMIAKLDACK